MILAGLTLLIWLGLLFLWHGYWRSTPDLPGKRTAELSVAILIPARDEANSIAATVRDCLVQQYENQFSVTVINDSSRDSTASLARAAGALVIDAPGLPPGWSGKLWALQQGVAAHPHADAYWFTDADIRHAPDTLARMAAQMQERDLVSVMAQLRCRSVWEKLLVPAFIYFFMLLYPFHAVADPRSWIAGAAGGSILIRRDMLERIGGIASYRNALIDDCTLARRVKQAGGRLWLGFHHGTQSQRESRTLPPLWQMVRRSAFNQLGNSYALLALTVPGLALVFLAPPLLMVAGLWRGEAATSLLAGLAWALMSASFLPTLRRYRLNPTRTLLLPVIALLYLLMTLDSARVSALGRGGQWKGRTHKPESRPTSPL